MEKSTEEFGPIKLFEPRNFINREGYYDCEIIDLSYLEKIEKPLKVFFEVFKGKYKGTRLSAVFYYKDIKGKARLTYLCQAVGILGELENPKELLGKRLKLRVLPKYNEYEGKTYRNYLITRFHSLK